MKISQLKAFRSNKMIKKWPPPCLFDISAYFVLRTLPFSGGVWLFRGNGR
jgi:hypothetical protein